MNISFENFRAHLQIMVFQLLKMSKNSNGWNYNLRRWNIPKQWWCVDVEIPNDLFDTKKCITILTSLNQ
jgi:hypothetical protein